MKTYRHPALAALLKKHHACGSQVTAVMAFVRPWRFLTDAVGALCVGSENHNSWASWLARRAPPVAFEATRATAMTMYNALDRVLDQPARAKAYWTTIHEQNRALALRVAADLDVAEAKQHARDLAARRKKAKAAKRRER